MSRAIMLLAGLMWADQVIAEPLAQEKEGQAEIRSWHRLLPPVETLLAMGRRNPSKA
jgi:hypothetical protein